MSMRGRLVLYIVDYDFLVLLDSSIEDEIGIVNKIGNRTLKYENKLNSNVNYQF